MGRTGTAFGRFCPARWISVPWRASSIFTGMTNVLVLVCILAALPSRAQASWPWGQQPLYTEATSGVPSGVTGGRAAGAGIPHYLPLVIHNYQPPQPAWSTILWEDFEGQPQPGWSFSDKNPGVGGEYWWARQGYRAYWGSSYSAWAVGGGADGRNLAYGANYPDNANSWMLYGPFSLEGAAMAQMRFQFWLNTAGSSDVLCYGASHDMIAFDAYCVDWGTSLDWTPQTLDLGDIGGVSMLGDPTVWVAFIFQSDGSGNAPEGAYVDDVEVRTCPTITCPLGVAAGSAQGAAPAGSEPVVLTPAR
jgi:hypothetical protein